MPFIEWNEKYSVHIEEIDSQHKKIFSIINRLHECHESPEGQRGHRSISSMNLLITHITILPRKKNISVSAATLILMFTNLNMI